MANDPATRGACVWSGCLKPVETLDDVYEHDNWTKTPGQHCEYHSDLIWDADTCGIPPERFAQIPEERRRELVQRAEKAEHDSVVATGTALLRLADGDTEPEGADYWLGQI